MESSRYYAGIGCTETPFDIQLLMYDIADFFGKKYTLRSGGAAGADTAFYTGAKNNKRPFEIFYPKDCTEAAMELSAKFHPAWYRCKMSARLKHGRNAMILLGKNLDTPVERVICWTPGGEVVGGTGQGLRIAEAYGIKSYNLYFEDIRKKFYELIYHGNV